MPTIPLPFPARRACRLLAMHTLLLSALSSEPALAQDLAAGIAPGETASGRLDAGDQHSANGRYEDRYVFDGNAGDTVRITLDSTDFDTFLSVIAPDGELIANDDYDGSSRSVVEFTVRENGRHRIVATSYRKATSGAYRLALGAGSAPSMPEVSAIDNGSPEIYGIFIGMADYPGVDDDLQMTDQDALRVQRALVDGAGMRAKNGRALVNSGATSGALRSAFADIAGRIDGNDMLVLFYSGHGNRYVRADGPDSADPDGLDESLELHDGPVLDDDLARMLDTVKAGRVLLVFDSCFSGGFAKDLVSAPGRMGLFSSEEDVKSQVAFNMEAGGYLAAFFEAALTGRADLDQDRELTALELSEYLHARYRADVHGTGAGDTAKSPGSPSSYQHVVVDRGGIGAFEVLFRH